MVCVPVIADSHLWDDKQDPDPHQSEKRNPGSVFKISEFTTPGKKDDLLEPGKWNLKVPREKEKVVPFFGIILKY